MKKLLAALAVVGALAALVGIAGQAHADPAGPNPYCAYDPTGNAGQWYDPCLPAGLQPDGRYNPKDLGPYAPPSGDDGHVQNPYAPGGALW